MRARILSASAGSGKTYQLAYKFVHDTIKYFEEKPYLYRAILAVTFTNKATEEMKGRILREIDTLATRPAESGYTASLRADLGLDDAAISKRARSIRSKILHDYSRFTVLTIDKFFQRILRAFIKELGIDLDYSIEIETASLLARSADSLIEDITRDDTLRRWIMEFAQESVDDNRRWDIRDDMLSLGRELFNENGKRTIADSVPKEALARAIREAEARSAAARAEMRATAERALAAMSGAGVSPEDFSGKSRSFALWFAAVAAGEEKAPSATVRLRAADSEKWAAAGSAAQALAPQLRPMLQRMCDIYDGNVRLWSTLPLVKETYRSYALLQDMYAKVRDLCEEEGVMLLPETKYILSRFIAGNDAPFIYEKTGNRFERFMIDEFQDTSLREWENFVPLLQNAMAQSEDTSVLIVGDVKQSIYRWRGGDWRILQEGVSRALGAEDTEVKVLSDNYRSLPRIVEFNNTVVERVVAQDNAELNGILKKAAEEGTLGAAACAELCDTLARAYAGHAQTPRRRGGDEGYVRIERFGEEPPLVECIEAAVARGYSYSDIMILYRKEADGARAARILLEYKRRNNAFNIMTQDALVVGRAAISNFVIAAMRLSQDGGDSISRAVMNDYLGRPYDAALAAEDRATLASISRLTPEEAFERIVMAYRLDERTDETAYLQAVHEQVISFCASKAADIQLFLKMWDERGAARSLSVEKSDSTIELTTIHKAKGLEKKVVIIPYCSWSLEPMSRSIVWAEPQDGDGLSEVGRFPVGYRKCMGESIFSDEYYREKVYSHVDNINMLYVALTRAEEALYVFVPDSGRRSVGQLLWEAVAQDAEAGAQSVEYGTAAPPVPSGKRSGRNGARSVLLRGYPTSEIRMALRLPAQRYFEEDGRRVLTPRSMGIFMHGVLGGAVTAADVERRMGEMRTAGTIGDAQAAELSAALRRELARPEVAEWFSENWDDVRMESDIICGETTGTRRPDRVMIKGDRAVVADYKFGAEKSRAHLRQVAEYMRLIRGMGYSRVEGYVWYLSLGEIVEVEP